MTQEFDLAHLSIFKQPQTDIHLIGWVMLNPTTDIVSFTRAQISLEAEDTAQCKRHAVDIVCTTLDRSTARLAVRHLVYANACKHSRHPHCALVRLNDYTGGPIYSTTFNHGDFKRGITFFKPSVIMIR
ncbi:hypothetical protein BT96DRAFT_673615 [Gymnopus androsaceus JB14]|uniref:Uncharacterized protein n=1 Tax=Gymnopus androsaceus JB14 TaxID=1447944 RepID=A0A6A4HTG1_9AGAR|nr:hypothetical protein BT96DRAFT_673615 [Gymnopus androsaceus JB14]